MSLDDLVELKEYAEQKRYKARSNSKIEWYWLGYIDLLNKLIDKIKVKEA